MRLDENGCVIMGEEKSGGGSGMLGGVGGELGEKKLMKIVCVGGEVM